MSDQTLPPSISAAVLKSAPAPPFHTRYGFSRPSSSLGSGIALTIEPYDAICHRGVLRPTILVSAVDLVASLFVREQAGFDVTFTSDLSLRAPRCEVPDRIDVRGEVLRLGKRLITTAVSLEAGGEHYAYGEATFMRLPRKIEPGRPGPTLEELGVPAVIERHTLSRPLAEEVGIESTPDGGVLVELRDALLNPEGVLQGALVALIVECAVHSYLDSAHRDVAKPPSGVSQARSVDRPAPLLTAIDLRYLAAARVGPVVAQVTPIASGDTSLLRVELRDRGAENRLTTTALVGLGNAARDSEFRRGSR